MAVAIDHDAEYADNDSGLQEICRGLREQPLLAFDSEFVRTNTFFPKPGLFQLNDGHNTSLIDPLDISDWSCFRQLIQQSTTTIIMHAGGEDLGLLKCFLGVIPARLFDTQRAAAFVGYGYSLSYQALVAAELGIELPKGETRSDWLQRPLTGTQLEYAALDVVYLVELATRLTDKLRQRNMLHWFEQDCLEILASVPDEFAESNWENAYRNIGGAWQLSGQRLSMLQKLAFWREKTARRRDRPRNWILKDQELLDLASSLPAEPPVSPQDLAGSGVLSSRFVDRDGRALCRFINQQGEFAEPASVGLVSRPLTGSGRKKLKALQGLTREQAARLDISPELLARKRLWTELLDNAASGAAQLWPAGLNNWRRELLEDAVMAILAPNNREEDS